MRVYIFNSNSLLFFSRPMTSFLLTSLPHQHASPDVERLLIGSKCDLEEERVVESKRGEQLARSQGIPFMETSAKTNHNIDEVRGHLMRSEVI